MDYEESTVNSITAGGFPFPKLNTDENAETDKQFEWVKYVALHHLGCQIFDKLEIKANILHCKEKSFEGEESLAQTIFGWSFEHFICRRSYSVEGFVKTLSLVRQTCVEEKKFIIDINELVKYTKLILLCYLQQIDDMYFDLNEFLRGAETTLIIHEPLRDVFTRYSIDSSNWRDSINATEFVRRVSKTLSGHIRESYVNNVMQELILNRLEGAYVSKFYESNTDVLNHESEQSTKRLKSEKENVLMQINNENDCFQNLMDFINNETQNLRERIASRSRLYEIEYENVLNRNSYLKTQIDKMQSSRQFYNEELNRFREVLEESRLREIRRAQIEEQRKLDHEMKEKTRKRKRKRPQSKSKNEKFLNKKKV